MPRRYKRFVAAIDPGLGGAIVFMEDTMENPIIRIHDMPTSPRPYGKWKKQVCAATLAQLFKSALSIDGKPVAHCVIEQVGSTPQMGVTSAFNFGHTYGVVQGVVTALGIPVSYVNPRKWKAEYSLNGKDKGLARTTALNLYPGLSGYLNLKKHIDRAEALLIARCLVDQRSRRKERQ